MDTRPVIRLLKGLNRIYAHGYQRVTVQTPPTLPAAGPAILVCNHISGVDPLLLQGVLKRAVIWMMAKEYYEIPALKWLFRIIEIIPVDRGGRDMAATRAALRALEHGEVLGVFPEGRIEPSRELLPFQTGVAMMAARTETSVYPAYMDGTTRGQKMLPAFFTPHETRVRFGPPVHFPTTKGQKPDLNISTGLIFQAVGNLRRQMTCED